MYACAKHSTYTPGVHERSAVVCLCVCVCVCVDEASRWKVAIEQSLIKVHHAPPYWSTDRSEISTVGTIYCSVTTERTNEWTNKRTHTRAHTRIHSCRVPLSWFLNESEKTGGICDCVCMRVCFVCVCEWVYVVSVVSDRCEWSVLRWLDERER